jgi:hypothetical protein
MSDLMDQWKKHLCDQIQVELHDVEFEKQFINLFVHETINIV